MSWTYGQARSGDFHRINELFMEMLKTVYQTEEAEGYEAGALDRFFAGGEEWICTVEDMNEIIAFLSIEVHHEEKPYLYLDDLSVTKQYRNKGIGTELLKRAEEYAEEIRIGAIRLHVERCNTAALRLYERLGYSVYEEQGNRVLMLKEL